MKKLLSAILTALMLFSMLIIPVSAESDCTVNLIVGETTLSTLNGNAGDAVPYTVPEAGEGKYFVGWFDKDGKTVEKFTAGTTDVYAKFEDYKASAVTDYTSGNFDDEKNMPLYYGYTYDGTYYNSIRTSGNAANQGKTAQLNHTANENGMLIAQGNNGYTSYGLRDENGITYFGGQDKDGSTTYGDMAIGEKITTGWGQGDYLTVRNADGSAFIVKPNTAYKISVTYKTTDIGGGTSLMGISIGMFTKNASSNGNAYDNHTNAFNVNVANRVALKTVNEDYVTETVILNSGNLEGAVPTICVNFSLSKVIAEKTGVSKEITGGISYQFKVTSRTEVFIKEISVAEVTVSDVTVIDGDKETVLSGEAGEAIPYSASAANRSYDAVYSLSSTEYVPAPTVFGSEDVTVYLLKNPVISFENYPSISYAKDAVNVKLSDEKAYSGAKSIKWESAQWGLLNAEPSDWATKWKSYYIIKDGEYVKLGGDTAPVFEAGKYHKNRVNQRESAIGLWKLEVGKSYKVTYKYYLANKLSSSLNIEPYTNGTNLWTNYDASTKKGIMYYDSSNTAIPTATKVGEWLDGEIYITVSNDILDSHAYLYLWVKGATTGDDAVYFDDFAYTEMDVVNFNTGTLSASISNFNGTNTSGVYNIYAEKGSDFAAPEIHINGNKVFDNWYTDDTFTTVAAEFVAGNTYYARNLTRGDCDASGEVDAADLAALKLKLAGSGEVHNKAADITSDGKINTSDLADLKLTLAGAKTNDELKVLGIGNSFTVDGTQYLWNIANAAGEENFLLARAYIGGCSLNMHWSNIQADSASYSFEVNRDGDWTDDANSSSAKLSDILVFEDWDVIVIQQVSQSAGDPTTYGNLQNIIDYIKETCPDAKIMWQMTWAYQADSTHSGFAAYNNDQMTMYNAIISTAQEKIVANPDIDGIIPSGTAIQNLRTAIGDNTTRDGYHLTYDYGRYTAALTWYKAITGKGIDGVYWTPESYSYIANSLEVMKSSANDAVDTPYAITNQTN